jgi:penicillin-binding protein 2
MNKRSKFVLYVFVLIFAILIYRIYYISITSHSYYEKLAKKNILKTQYTQNARGLIFDTKNKILALNKIGFSIFISPYLKNTDINNTLNSLIKVLPNLNKEKMLKRYKLKKSIYLHNNIKIVDLVSYDDMIYKYPRINIIDNIFIKPSSKRYYPYNDIASHIIGYVASINEYEKKHDPSYNKIIKTTGKTGIEKYYEQFLRGELNIRKYTANSKNEEIEEIQRYISNQNTNLTLTLDMRLQKFIHKYFKKHNYKGVAIVMDSTNGDILSAISAPEYDLNLFYNGISVKNWKKLINDLSKPFTNKITHGLYPPGSLVKMGVGLSFLQNGISIRDTSFCTGEYLFANQKFRCWMSHGHKVVNLRKAISRSCDDYFYKHSYKIGINNISKTLKELGLGSKTLIDLPNEFSGTVPNKDWKKNKYGQPWYVGETFISSIGQGYNLVTPIQLAKYTAFISNYHEVIPHFIKKIGNIDIKYDSLEVLDKKDKKRLRYIKKAMYDVCNTPQGTGYKYVRHSRYILSCKTGTAQVSGISQSIKKRLKEKQLKYLKRSHAWFTSFFPKSKPKYTITILVEHGGYGSKMGTIAADIVNYMRRIGYVR